MPEEILASAVDFEGKHLDSHIITKENNEINDCELPSGYGT